MSGDNPIRFLIIGGGPAGTMAATVAASLGAKVTLVESSIIGGAAHLWDCIPSKTMVASSIRMNSIRNAEKLGFAADQSPVDLKRLAARIDTIATDLSENTTEVLEDQGVRLIKGRGRFVGPHQAIATTADGDIDIEFDVALISTGSAPRVPDWATVDGTRIITTREAYHLGEVPEHMIVVGSGVTGVEFVSIFASMGSQVTLLVSRQQVLPHRDAEVAAALEEDFLERGVKLLKGARAIGAELTDGGVVVSADDGRSVTGSHVLLAIGSIPLTTDLGLEAAGVQADHGYVPVDEFQRTNVPYIYAAGDVTGKLPLSSVASMQGRKLARHALGHQVKPLDYSKVAQAIFAEPEIASVGLEEADLAAAGRRIRSTKVPFASNSRSVIQGQERGFVKVFSDPATHEVLGGTIVGHRASELIGILALAVQGRLHVETLVETLMVHPSLSESLTEAAE